MEAPRALVPGRFAVWAWPMTNTCLFPYVLSDTLRDLNGKHLIRAMPLGLAATSTLAWSLVLCRSASPVGGERGVDLWPFLVFLLGKI